MLVLPSYNKVLKRTLIYCKLQNVFKSQDGTGKSAQIQRVCLASHELLSGEIYKYTHGRCNCSEYGQTSRHLTHFYFAMNLEKDKAS